MKAQKVLFCMILVTASSLLPYAAFDLNHPTECLKIVKNYIPDNPVIFEAGAYDGTETVSFVEFWPNATVYTFEPVPELFSKVVAKSAGCKNIHAFPLAISDAVGIAEFHLSSFEWSPDAVSQSSSLLPPKEHLNKASFVKFGSVIEVPTITIDEWAHRNNVDHVDLMWLDMQGSELQALKAAPNILKTVKVILTEVELVEAYAGQPLYNEVKTWLESQGFEMIAIDFDTSNKEHWFGDALFVRKQ